jgi:NAD+ diphosphatase
MPTDKTYWFIVQNDGLLLLKIRNALPTDEQLKFIAPHFLRYFDLGSLNNINYFCAEIDKTLTIPESFHIQSLRNALSLFDLSLYPIAAKAYSIIRWDRNHQFCGYCCNLTEPQAQGFERVCTLCHLSFFPRISPSIIVLVKNNDHLLLARGPNFLPGVYGLIAGFVEVGESLEEAVHREVKEEVGIEIKNLVYYGSQSWPFPDSLMIAFTAEYRSGDIVINEEEIEAAGWYRYDSLPGRPSMSLSIATKLIDDFLISIKNSLNSVSLQAI